MERILFGNDERRIDDGDVPLVSFVKSFVPKEHYPPITVFYNQNIKKLSIEEVEMLIESTRNLEKELKDFLMLLYRTSK